jgi:hypothetical protein
MFGHHFTYPSRVELDLFKMLGVQAGDPLQPVEIFIELAADGRAEGGVRKIAKLVRIGGEVEKLLAVRPRPDQLGPVREVGDD